ncbi:ATP-binding cassette long-chain fatty acid transporter pxa2 [Coemansia spiralis]|uniref:ATP-binding cassette long-chain fatty acid transporter pxa2 n=1 Tax=Coemansia spiralis TaxID=417178 RepID=A0A9W8GNJ0_9FUNG|nr:ATP-binding cassette long-chain fatty acid transporter pxa2 [Coemansia spiralis]
MVEDGRADSPGFLGIQVISSGSSSDKGGDTGRRENSESGLYFEGAHIPNGQKPQAPHFASLTMRVDCGHHCLIVGGTLARRQAVFKALLGTQTVIGGLVGSPTSTIHVSSRPYIKPGSSLWDLIIFPHDKTQSIKRGVSERHLAAILRLMDFEFLLTRADDDWGRVVDWAKVLGAGELYALALARLVYHSPPFALLDDISCLRGDQIRQLFTIARRHHITLVIASSDPDPFDPLARRSESPLLACIAEFTRALRLSDSGDWIYCSFGYASQRGAFDDEPCDLIWGMASGDSRLRRRVSALSQCSTTERRWLMATESAGDSSRRQSRVVSPTLTARSSMSDMNAADFVSPSIGRALAKSALLLLPASTDAADTRSQVGSPGPASLGSTSRTSSAGRSDYEPIVAAAAAEAQDAQSLPLAAMPPTPVSAIPQKVDSPMESGSVKQTSNQTQQQSVAEQPSVFSPAKNPYARPKNYQRSRPSLSLFASKQAASEPKQVVQPAMVTPITADTSRRPFSRNGEEEGEQSKDVEVGTAPITPITPTAFVAESPLRAPSAKARQVSATPSISSGSISRIPRPPSSVSRIDRTSQQPDSASVTSPMATLSIGGSPAVSDAPAKTMLAGDSDYAGQQPLTLDEFTAALNNM